MSRTKGLLAIAVAGVVLIAACGDDKGSSSTTAAPATTAAAATTAAPATTAAAATTAAPATGLDAAKAVVAKVLNNPPKGIPAALTALPSKPPKKKVAWLACDVPTCTDYLTPGYKAATAAIGWDLVVIPAKSTDPSAAFQQAIDAGADYITITGSPYATYKDQALAAAAKGISVFSCYSTDTPSVEANMLTECGDTNLVGGAAPLMADFAIVDSNSKANVLFVTINDFTVLKAEGVAFKSELNKNCPDCIYQELNVTLADLLAGKIPGAIASQLQANSKLNYLMYSFGDLPGGVADALKAAGLDKQVKVIGGDWSKSDLPLLIDGTQLAWNADPKAYAAWLTIDAMARLATGTSPADLVKFERQFAGLQTFVLTDKTMAQQIFDAGGDWMPEGAPEAFKKLWGM